MAGSIARKRRQEQQQQKVCCWPLLFYVCFVIGTGTQKWCKCLWILYANRALKNGHNRLVSVICLIKCFVNNHWFWLYGIIIRVSEMVMLLLHFLVIVFRWLFSRCMLFIRWLALFTPIFAHKQFGLVFSPHFGAVHERTLDQRTWTETQTRTPNINRWNERACWQCKAFWFFGVDVYALYERQRGD